MTRQFAVEVLKITLFRPLSDNKSISTINDASKLLRNSIIAWYQVWDNAKGIYAKNDKELDKLTKMTRNAELTYHMTEQMPNLIQTYRITQTFYPFSWNPYDKKDGISEDEWNYFWSTFTDWKIETREAIITLIGDKDFDNNPWDDSPSISRKEDQILELLKKNLEVQETQHAEVIKLLDQKSYEPIIYKLTHSGKQKEILIIPSSKNPGRFNFTTRASYENVVSAIKGIISIRELYDSNLFVKDSGEPYSSFESFEESLRGRSKRLKK